MNKATFSDHLTPSPILDTDQLPTVSVEEKESMTQNASEKNLRPNKFSFSNLFNPIPSRVEQDSPSMSKWLSRVPSFVGSLFEKKESSPNFENLTIEAPVREETVIQFSPETVKVVTSTPISFSSSSSNFTPSCIQSATVPQQTFFNAGDQDRKFFVISLTKKLQALQGSEDSENQLKKDIDRISYSINGKSVRDVETLKAFFGDAAESLLPVLNQTIVNVAADVVAQCILNTAPDDATYAELAMDDSKKYGTSINIVKKEGSSDFHIEVDSKGSPTTFLKKIGSEGTPDFEMITLPEEDDYSEEAKLSGEGRQFVALELSKNKEGSYAMSCSSLFRKYTLQT